MGLRTVLWLSVAVVLVGYYFYQPVPEGYSKPLDLYPQIAKFRFMVAWLQWMDELGVKGIHDTVEETYQKTHPVDHPDTYTDLEVTDVIFDDVTVRLYRPKGRQQTDTKLLPGLVYYHGGGFVIGSPHSFDNVMIYLLREVQLVIASVHYRMAPKYPFPVPVEDCVRATRYFMTHAAEYGVDANRIGVAGDSAGGNLAAVVSLKLRDERFSFQPKIQALIYPAVQMLDLKTPSYQQNTNGPILTRYLAIWFMSQYLVGDNRYIAAMLNNSHTTPEVKKSLAKNQLNHDILPKKLFAPPYKPQSLDHGDPEIWRLIQEKITSPYMSPLLAASHADLPTAFVFTAGADVLRDDGFFYVHKLKQDGVEVEHLHIPSGYHGMLRMMLDTPETWELMGNLGQFLREEL